MKKSTSAHGLDSRPLLLILTCCLAGLLRSEAATLVWTNTAGGFWNLVSNWSPNQFPTAADDVFITNNGDYTVTAGLSLAKSVTLGGEAGTQTFSMTGGSLTVTAGINIGTNGVFDPTGVSGTITVNGRLRVTDGAALGGGTVNIGSSGTLEISSGTLTFGQGAILNTGGVIIANGAMLSLGGGTFTNLVGGTLLLTNNSTKIGGATTGTFFANLGHMISVSNTVIGVPSLLGGTIDVKAGELILGSTAGAAQPLTVSFAGTINVESGASLAFTPAGTATFLPGSLLDGAGRFRVNGLSTVVNFMGEYNLKSLLIEGTSTASFDSGSPKTLEEISLVDGAISPSGQTAGTLIGSDPLTVTKQLLWGNGATIGGTAPFLIGSNALATAPVNVGFGSLGSVFYEGPALLNAGEFFQSGRLNLLFSNGTFTNLTTGTLYLTNNNGAIGNFTTTVATNQLFVNLGRLVSSLNQTVEVSSSLGGKVEINSGELEIGRPNLLRKPLPTLVASGAVMVASGAFLTILNTETNEFLPDSYLSGDGGFHTHGSSGHTMINGKYELAGPLWVEGGVVNFDTGSARTFGTVILSVGDIAGSDPLTVVETLNWGGAGTFSGTAPVLLSPNANTSIYGIATIKCPAFLNGGNITESGEMILDASNVGFTNLPGGQFVITNRNSVVTNAFLTSGDGTNRSFVNEGTIRNVAGNLVEKSTQEILNAGIIRCEKNQLLFEGVNLTQTAGSIELAGGNLAFDGSHSLILHGGSVSGIGKIIGGNVTNIAGTINPGDSPGIISLDRSFSQFADGTLRIQLAGTQPGIDYDQIQVADTVTLDGELGVTRSFASGMGDQFLIIDNQGSNPVIGNFNGLAQDAILTIGGEQFQISYVGGDGNDVVLTQTTGSLSLPELAIQFMPPDKILLLWATNYPNFVPGSTTNLTEAFAVEMVTPSILGPYYVVTNSMAVPSRFYRLEKLGP